MGHSILIKSIQDELCRVYEYNFAFHLLFIKNTLIIRYHGKSTEIQVGESGAQFKESFLSLTTNTQQNTKIGYPHYWKLFTLFKLFKMWRLIVMPAEAKIFCASLFNRLGPRLESQSVIMTIIHNTTFSLETCNWVASDLGEKLTKLYTDLNKLWLVWIKQVVKFV